MLMNWGVYLLYGLHVSEMTMSESCNMGQSGTTLDQGHSPRFDNDQEFKQPEVFQCL